MSNFMRHFSSSQDKLHLAQLPYIQEGQLAYGKTKQVDGETVEKMAFKERLFPHICSARENAVDNASESSLHSEWRKGFNEHLKPSYASPHHQTLKQIQVVDVQLTFAALYGAVQQCKQECGTKSDFGHKQRSREPAGVSFQTCHDRCCPWRGHK